MCISKLIMEESTFVGHDRKLNESKNGYTMMFLGKLIDVARVCLRC